MYIGEEWFPDETVLKWGAEGAIRELVNKFCDAYDPYVSLEYDDVFSQVPNPNYKYIWHNDINHLVFTTEKDKFAFMLKWS